MGTPWLKANAANTCLGPRDDSYGSFIIPWSGVVISLGSLSIRVFRRGRQPEENILRTRTVLSPRFLNYRTLMHKRYLAMWMWLCEGKLKVKIAHFRLPSASQKRVFLSSLMFAGLPGQTKLFGILTNCLLLPKKKIPFAASSMANWLCREWILAMATMIPWHEHVTSPMVGKVQSLIRKNTHIYFSYIFHQNITT